MSEKIRGALISKGNLKSLGQYMTFRLSFVKASWQQHGIKVMSVHDKKKKTKSGAC